MLGFVERKNRFPFIAHWSTHISNYFPVESAFGIVAKIPRLVESFNTFTTSQLNESTLSSYTKNVLQQAAEMALELNEWEFCLPDE